jgi:hypothetical protein
MKRALLSLTVLALVTVLAAPSFAEPAPQSARLQDKARMENELVRLKYVPADRVRVLLSPYLSREGRITMMPNENVIVVSDLRENIEKVLRVIKQLDVKPADLLITVQLVLGSEAGEPGKESMTNDPIIRELRNLLKYKSYSLLDASLLRAMDGTGSEVRIGDKADFEFWVRPKVVRDENSSLIQMEVRLRQIRLAGTPPNATSSKPEYITTDLIATTLNIKSGDKTVVGVSKLDGGDKGLILILSGKVVD